MPPGNFILVQMGIARMGGGVSTLARMVWGTYLEKNCPSSNGHLLDCGGVKMLARMVWGTCAVKIEVQMGICLIVGGSKSVPGWFGALITINTLI